MNRRTPRRAARHSQPLILTIGHSNRSLEEFLALLKAHGVKRLVDVRTVPRSLHNPQFNREALPQVLRDAGIAYTHLAKLGGLRHARADSPNAGWNNLSFRGFADYMRTPDFAAGLKRLEKLARAKLCALLCAEAVPWRCHRSLIADALTVRDHAVEHIMSRTRRNLHKLTPFARVSGASITYPATRATRAALLPKPSRRRNPRTIPRGGLPMIQIARVYEKVQDKSSARYLVERLWPRGIKKESLSLDGWLKDVAPSDVLRRWFGHRPERWLEFRKRYLAELRANPEAWRPLLEAAHNVTLLYSARDTEHNGALVLQQFLNMKLKP